MLWSLYTILIYSSYYIQQEYTDSNLCREVNKNNVLVKKMNYIWWRVSSSGGLSIHLLQLLPGPFWLGMIVPIMVSINQSNKSMKQIIRILLNRSVSVTKWLICCTVASMWMRSNSVRVIFFTYGQIPWENLLYPFFLLVRG